MENFDLKQIEPLLFIVVGLLAILFPIVKMNRLATLKDTGEKVEGIVNDLQQEESRISGFESSASVKDKITIRFVTKEKEWITAELKQPFALFFTGQYKPGDRVDVYYDPINPASFYVDTKQSDLVARIIIGVVGLFFFLIGLYKFLA